MTLTEVTTTAGQARLGTQRAATAEISDSEGSVNVAMADASTSVTVNEGDAATFTVELTGGTVSSDLAVRYAATPGTASGADYAQARGTLTIAKDSNSGTFKVEIVDDDLEEGAEEFTVSLSLSGQPAHVGLGTREATVTINASDTLRATLDGPTNVAEGKDGDVHGDALGRHQQRTG